MNLLDPTHPRATQMRSILEGLGAKQTPQITDPPVMGQGNPMAGANANPVPFMGPNNPMTANPLMMISRIFGR